MHPQDSTPPPDADDDIGAASDDTEGHGVSVAGLEAEEVEGPDRRRFVARHEGKVRLDVYLQNRLKGISRSRIQKLIELGGVTVAGARPKASTAVKAGDAVEVILPPQGTRRIEAEPIPLDVLYEDEHFVVLNKQAGLIVHPARSHLSGTLLNGLAYRFKQRVEAGGGVFRPATTRGFKPPTGRGAPSDEGRVEGLSGVGAQEFRPGIIHRLDKNTTGVMVVGKSDEAHWGIARQFEDRTTLKAYLALVHGHFEGVGGAVEQPIGKHPTIREACAVRHDSSARHALTLYRVREQYRGYALVELELKTGRTHQIRVHMGFLGHPIAGDILYGGEPLGEAEIETPPTPAGGRRFLSYARDKDEGQRIEREASARPDMLLPHPALHAALLRFTHPIRGETMTFTAPLHESFAGVVRRLRAGGVAGPVAREGYWVDLAAAIPDLGG